MLLRVDRVPADDAPEQEKLQALYVYRKITVLRCSPCCGMCGTTRYSTKPYWSIGMRVCRDCIQANMVSQRVLYERYWITLGRPIQGYPSFVDAVAGRVFFFHETMTPHQRLEYSSDRMDFPGGRRCSWFFWLPHVSKILDMDALAQEAKKKHTAAKSIRAHIRRCLVLRALAGSISNERTKPTVLTTYTTMRKDTKRTAIFRLRKTELLDKVDWYHEQRVTTRLSLDLQAKLMRFKDRVLPPHLLRSAIG
jgi:hypothetical protein